MSSLTQPDWPITDDLHERFIQTKAVHFYNYLINLLIWLQTETNLYFSTMCDTFRKTFVFTYHMTRYK